MRRRSILFLLASFLLSCVLTISVMACPPPDCGSCCYWVSYGPSSGYCAIITGVECGDCAECNPCYTCAGCTCEWDCTPGQCCDDGECVNTCPDCKTCVSQVCEDDIISSIIAENDEICVGCDVTFTVTTNPAGNEDDVSWSCDGNPSSDTGVLFTTSWDTIGTKTITASLCDSSLEGEITIIEVVSVTADDNLVCVDEEVTFTVTTNPSGHYDPVNWTAVGGTPPSQEGGETFTTKWSTSGSKTVTATCGSSDEYEVVTVKGLGTITATESVVCDNEVVTFQVVTDPPGEESNISWSGGGEPATGTGATFDTKWTTGEQRRANGNRELL
ncbi:MAG: hypothetical protein JXN61_09750 [Sedimentisphaerales bacterium]|nr:hypothetical protein [Sedimentisphaerales bacterium]